MGGGYLRLANKQMGVSKNWGIPKSSILIGFSIINHPFWGTIIFGNTQIETCPWLQHCRLMQADYLPMSGADPSRQHNSGRPKMSGFCFFGRKSGCSCGCCGNINIVVITVIIIIICSWNGTPGVEVPRTLKISLREFLKFGKKTMTPKAGRKQFISPPR